MTERKDFRFSWRHALLCLVLLIGNCGWQRQRMAREYCGLELGLGEAIFLWEHDGYAEKVADAMPDEECYCDECWGIDDPEDGK